MPLSHTSCVRPVPTAVGIGLRAPHHDHVMAQRPAVPFFELHSENFFAAGGPNRELLDALRTDYPLSLHGVGLSLGAADALDADHLAQLRALVAHVEPGLVSEHVCWGAVDGRHYNDLLPLPYTEEALALMTQRVQQVQEMLGRTILVENVSSYIHFTHSTLREWEFLAELSRRSGCGLLLDVNNVYVNSVNHGFDPLDFLDGVPGERVGEMHLAGFTRKQGLGGELLIDSHNRRVDDAVWDLYVTAVRRFGPKPTLIEWDQDLPDFAVLEDEARIATEHLHARAAVPA
ncbi:DUF692 domain-containing protein [Oleiagrimonas sp. MCCC 1A03011]|uniref:MNIO family bufferin maturase n=1 Tax=Oleiagrimonas sp. MCCC 1A03011 TaxID=1926883 RepID=UPI000DC56322|nr:DUF692 domain-containing protein [Oleiagrimonas sp. MCCC 1A03011]RAP56943.1 hypothetical protein BTJ49_12460 [Oleiagrimonas sp. MCCC 1A03011]